MLTAKENFREVVRGGNPDRYSNNYEAISLLFSPAMVTSPGAKKGGPEVVNAWGVTNVWPEGTPGGFPVHTPDKIVLKDIEQWQDYVKAPSLKFPQELWDQMKAMYDAVDGTKAYKACFVAPGLFEHSHHLMSMQEALIAYMINPDEVKELIKYLVDYELEMAEGICSNLKPDMIFHHDDWGSEINSFLRPQVFDEFFTDAYKTIYSYYKSHGVELIVHHSDSYAANLVPYMIEMGIDVWQGCIKSNDVPGLIKQYGGKISFMGEIDNKQVDFEGWTDADCYKAAEEAIARCGNKYFIPCISQGGPGSTFPGTYMSLVNAIDDINCKTFGFTKEQLEAAREPLQIMF